MKPKWILKNELPNKRYKDWLNTKGGFIQSFWNEIDPNNLKSYSDIREYRATTRKKGASIHLKGSTPW